MKGTTRGLGRVAIAVALGLAGCTAVLGIDKEYEADTGIGGATSSASSGPGSGGGGTVTSSSSVGGGGSSGTGGSGGGTGGSGGSGGGGGGSGGSGGATGECVKPADCPPPPNVCVMATCVMATCGTINVPQGVKPAMQIEGDCKTHVCTGNGTFETVEDATDPADDMKECTKDMCVGAATTHTNASPGTACSQNGGKVCNNTGSCVDCTNGLDCMGAGKICQSGHCVSPTCANAKKDGGETDVDCGGPECNPCSTNKLCMMPSDCVSIVCIGNKCQTPTCLDAVKNGTETDVDCGGASCPDCASGLSCIAPSDCQSGVCAGGKCQAPSCLDTVKNGAETDVDCGGGVCVACANGQQCAMNSDCMSNSCVAGLCEQGLPGDGGQGGGN
jgi:hypothetical protein